MCGIVGWLRVGGGPYVDPVVLGRMRDALAHRGPDGCGLWQSDDRSVGLGFRRLAIVDLSAAAGQPMANEDGTVQVVFNGEIYNHRALRTELEAHGHRFRTDHSDTEVIVHGYEQWGADVVVHLDGMFAIGVWDAPARTLLLARDRVGIKPLYVTRTTGALLFGSEIKALLHHPAVARRLDPAALHHYLSFMVPPAPLTLFEGIYKLPAGYRASARQADGRLAPDRYWDALPGTEADPDASLRQADTVGTVRALLDRAVAKRLMSDVPLGVLLSGGIDSSAITALASRHAGGAVRTFTVGYSDHTRLNELDEARRVSQHFGTDHHEVLVDEGDMRRYLPQLVTSQDEPIADWVCIPLYFVSKLVRDSGTIVTLVGEGADEEFCGYRSYMGYLRLHDRYWRPWRRAPLSVRRAGAAVAARVGAHRPDLALYSDIPARAAAGQELFWGGAIAFWESQKRLLLAGGRPATEPPEWLGGLLPAAFCGSDSHAVVQYHVAELQRQAPAHDILMRMTYLELKQRLPELLLMRVDKITMSTSVEARVPFLDPSLVRFTMGLPRAAKVPGGRRKALLRAACRGLIPDAVIDREKRGFGAPMAEWLRGEFGREAEAAVLRGRLAREGLFEPGRIGQLFAMHRSGRDTSVPIWTLYNLAAWYDRWMD